MKTAAQMGGENVSDNNMLWEEQSNNMVYNLKTKVFDFGNIRATNYKHNSRFSYQILSQLRKRLIMTIENLRWEGSFKGR